MTYVDRTLTCVDCGVEFIHSAADQEYYHAEGVHVGPQALRLVPRLPALDARRRRLRRARDRRPARLRAHRGPRSPREYFAAICTSCGNQAQVPFKPRMDKPVYCSDCFRQIRPD